MQAYMKSAMPYRGVRWTEERRICRESFAQHPLATFEEWCEAALGLWRGARYREERYATIELLEYRAYQPFRTMRAMPVYEELITTGAWWDYVDAVAIRLVGPLVLTNPAVMKRKMRAWSRSPDVWKRRSSIVCQVALKRETDLELLDDCIQANLENNEFWIRKAIGWSLRQYAWLDPKWVKTYVERNREALSGLSRREALKNIG
jgi:3-methyladenine DNA glycosylase AlkD